MAGVYPENFESKIGFNRIRDMVKNHCLSSLGEECTEKMHFSADYGYLQARLGETDEFLRILREYPQFPVSHYLDCRKSLEKIRLEGRYIEAEELFDLKKSLETVRAIALFFSREKERIFPNLSFRVQGMKIYPYLHERIDAILDKYGKIRDNATAELAAIRKEILSLQSGISRKLQAILKQGQQEGWVEEGAAIAIRDGRAVIPVPSFNKRKLKGIVFDESATGKTSYVEPAEIVELNNEIRELENRERREIIKILTRFSNEIRPYIDDLITTNEIMGEVDFIRAKALLSRELGAIKPDFSSQSAFSWKQAVHPLLMISLKRENREIVPLDIALDQEQHILLISGPNAGGKSVCLKTVGLLQFMLQNGLLIPVQEGSKTGIFDHIFIDIGDEQSIEDDLSTYSSHLLNMKYFLKNSNERTLVLIDEFGTGTEPMLGGAIAEAILNRLNMQNAFGIMTTHYANLKHFATSASGIVNGAMLYDSQKMSPLFILETGKPGSSFAFEIARKIGLPEEILQDATAKVGKKQIDFDKSLRSITRDKYYWETKRKKIRKVEKSLDEMAEDYRKELEEIKKQRKEILKGAKEEAQHLLENVNRQIENTIREIREAQAEKIKSREIRERMENFKAEVKTADLSEDQSLLKRSEKLEKTEIKRNKGRAATSQEVKVKKEPVQETWIRGEKIRIKGQETVYDLVDIDQRKAVIALGQILSTVALRRIEKYTGEGIREIPPPKGKSGLALTLEFSERRLNFKPEIDLRGERAETALAKVRRLLDDAVMFESSRLRILHGKGQGILKEMIRNYLMSEPLVRSFRDEDVRLGGAGITVVELNL